MKIKQNNVKNTFARKIASKMTVEEMKKIQGGENTMSGPDVTPYENRLEDKH